MPTRRRFVRALLAAALLLPAACTHPFDDSCGPEYRETIIRGDIQDASGARLGIAEFRLAEVRRDRDPRSLHPIVMGPGYGSAGAPLKGRVTRARLVGPAGETLFELSVAPGLADEVLRAQPVPIADEAAFTALKRSFKTGGVVLVLQTDLPGREQLRVPLPLDRAGDWDRAHCS